jgi:hypothetical protein
MILQSEDVEELTATNEAGRYIKVSKVSVLSVSVSLDAFCVSSRIMAFSTRERRVISFMILLLFLKLSKHLMSKMDRTYSISQNWSLPEHPRFLTRPSVSSSLLNTVSVLLICSSESAMSERRKLSSMLWPESTLKWI